jgi:hypothetical protein
MPVVVRTRDYDASFYAAVGVAEGEDLQQRAQEAKDVLFGDD